MGPADTPPGPFSSEVDTREAPPYNKKVADSGRLDVRRNGFEPIKTFAFLSMLAISVTLPGVASGQDSPHPALREVLRELTKEYPDLKTGVIIDQRFHPYRNEADAPIPADPVMNRAFAESEGLPFATLEEIRLCPTDDVADCRLREDITAGVTFRLGQVTQGRAVVFMKTMWEHGGPRLPFTYKIYRAVVRKTDRRWEVEEFDVVWRT